MKQRLIEILIGVVVTLGVMVGQPASPPPDVYLQWVIVGQTLDSTSPQSITIPLPQSNVSRYSYHYVYAFLSAPCTASTLNYGTYGTIFGSYPLSGATNRVVPIGGLIGENFVAGNNITGTVLTMKGNGAVDALSANLTLVAAPGQHFTGCNLDVLYKGTMKEEEGTRPLGLYAPLEISFSNYGFTPVTYTNGSATVQSFMIYNPGFGTTNFNNTVVIDDIYFCVNPVQTTGLYRATSPVELILNDGEVHNIGDYSVTNGCMRITSAFGAIGIIPKGGQMTAQFLYPTAVSYPTDASELLITVFGHNIY